MLRRTTRHDGVEPIHAPAQVHRQTVPRDTVENFDANRCELAITYPESWHRAAADAVDTARAQGGRERVLDRFHESAWPKPALRQTDDRVCDQLAGAMKRRPSSTAHPKERDAPRRELGRPNRQVGQRPAAAQRRRRRMLRHDDEIRYVAAPSRGVEAMLQRQASGVVEARPARP
jgi:hypothetical protein